MNLIILLASDWYLAPCRKCKCTCVPVYLHSCFCTIFKMN